MARSQKKKEEKQSRSRVVVLSWHNAGSSHSTRHCFVTDTTAGPWRDPAMSQEEIKEEGGGRKMDGLGANSLRLR